MAIHIPHLPKIARLAKRLCVNAQVHASSGNGKNVIENKVLSGFAPSAFIILPFKTLKRRELKSMPALLRFLLPMVFFTTGKGGNHGIPVIGPSLTHLGGSHLSMFGACRFLLDAAQTFASKSDKGIAHLCAAFSRMTLVPKMVVLAAKKSGLALHFTARSALVMFNVVFLTVVSDATVRADGVGTGLSVWH
ncbi:hypothetical protein AAE028_33675 [Sinorhizobium sp. CB9]